MLENRTIIVTGAAGGIGRATALILGAAGANVVASDIDANGADTVEAIRSAGGTGHFIRADVGSEPEVAALSVRRSSVTDGWTVLSTMPVWNRPMCPSMG